MKESEFRRTVARNLKRLRNERKLTQRDVASSSRIAEKYLSRIELGLATPSLHVAWRLSRVLETTLDRLVGLSTTTRYELAAIEQLLQACSKRELKLVLRLLAALHPKRNY